MTIQAKPEEASKVSTNCLFQIYWSYINAWSKFKTNAGEHGLPVHHQARRDASKTLVWVSFAWKANYHVCYLHPIPVCLDMTWCLSKYWIFDPVQYLWRHLFPLQALWLLPTVQSSVMTRTSSSWWVVVTNIIAIFHSPCSILPGVRRYESSEGSCSGKAESSWQFSAVAKASRHLLIP